MKLELKDKESKINDLIDKLALMEEYNKICYV
jgi:hypothetical protein